jgi:MoxR-like ATPase
LGIATQNPIEQEGTYPLPEAQLVRFLMKVKVGYNTLDEEIKIINSVFSPKEVSQVASREDILYLQEKVHKIHIDDELVKYIAKIVDATRNPQNYGLKTGEYLEYGASPRATLALFICSKAQAMLENKDYVTPLDIIKVSKNVLRHRLILNYKADIDEVSVEDIIDQTIKAIPLP